MAYNQKSLDYIDLVSANIDTTGDSDGRRFEYAIGDRIFENKIEWVKEDEIIILWNDITDLRRSKDRAKFMAYHDHLTALPNRRYFKEVVNKALNHEHLHFSLAFIDLDGFKTINDTAGHDIGDQVLIEVAHRITGVLSEDDFVARMGGDEFAILFNHTPDREALEEKIQGIKDAVCTPHTIDNRSYQISLSMGISQCPQNGKDYFTLLKKADIAMYNVKYTGKGNHKFYREN